MAGLVATYEEAEDIAAAFQKFREPVSDSASDITALISRLYHVSSATQKLEQACASPRNQRRKELIHDDIYDVLLSIRYTFSDINKFFGELDHPRFLTLRDGYRGVWGNIVAHFKEESSDPLTRRLLFYSQSLLDFSEIIEGSTTIRIEDVREIRFRTDKILKEQNAGPRGLETEFGNMTVGAPKQKSFERVRPDPPRRIRERRSRGELFGDLPAVAAGDFGPRGGIEERARRGRGELFGDLPAVSAGDFGTRRGFPERGGEADRPRPRRPDPRPPLAFPLDFEYDYGFPFYPEDEPSSPTTTTTDTTTSASTKSSNTSVITDSHWLPTVFNQSRPTTAFVTHGQLSACFGSPMPGARKRISDGYDKLLELPFETGELVVRLYLRESDFRARIHCRSSFPGRSRTESTSYLTNLRITRLDSCLQLLEPRQDRSSLKLWATLRFPSYERMVLFHCAFLALKVQDEGKPIRKLEDCELPGEELLFSAEIIDDSYRHILRIFKDDDSNGVRLQASAMIGAVKGMPVWTAFITYKVASRSWIRYDEGRKVHLRDLQRYVFTSEYYPTLSPGEVHELTFTKSKDAMEFADRIEDIAEQRV